MKRMMLLVGVVAAFGMFTSIASASPGATPGAHRLAATKTTWTAEYTFAPGYGEVKCKGTTTVSKKYPFGKEVEVCESTSTFTRMKAGKEQKAFELEGGGSYSEWESDSGSGKRTTNYSYSVNKKLTKFKLVAIYES